MRYVPTSASAPTELAPSSATAAVRRAIRELRSEAERRATTPPAWASRSPRGPSVHASYASVLAGADAADASPARASDPLAAPLAQLRAATARYVHGLRASGARPEQMLVQVKRFVREAMTADGWYDPEAAQALTEAVVRWSIAAYYDR